MRQPFWILNSSLLLALVICLMIIFLSNAELPIQKTIEPAQQAVVEQARQIIINNSIIYDKDIFGTYSMKESPAKEPAPIIAKLPPAPQPIIVPVPAEPSDTFLEPLAILLTGTITLSDDSKNKAIVLDTKTQLQASYKVGDELEDAQLIRVFRNKAIFLRSNGQQETIYLDQDEELIDYPVIDWKQIIETISQTNYLVDLQKFIEKVTSISEFINQVNLTEAYKNGTIVGIKIGAAQEDSLGVALGFKPGDIITSVNDIPASEAEEIYNNIKNQKEGSIINIKISRGGLPIENSYTLKDIIFPSASVVAKEEKLKKDDFSDIKFNHDKIEKEKLKILRKKYTFAKTAFELKNNEDQNIKKLAAR